MDYIIGTIIIMLFCITALAREKSVESTIILARPAAKLPKPDRTAAEQTVKRYSQPATVPAATVQVLIVGHWAGPDNKNHPLPNIPGRPGQGLLLPNATRGFQFSGFRVQNRLSTRFYNTKSGTGYALISNRSLRVAGGAVYVVRGNAMALVTQPISYAITQRTYKEQTSMIHTCMTWRGVTY